MVKLTIGPFLAMVKLTIGPVLAMVIHFHSHSIFHQIKYNLYTKNIGEKPYFRLPTYQHVVH